MSTKTVKLPITSIQFNKAIGKYVILTAPSKSNPFNKADGTTGACQMSAKQLENIASKTPAGNAGSLINLVGFGDASLNVVITGTHKAGDLVLDDKGQPIEVPMNERGTEPGQKATNSEGQLVFKADGFNFDQLAYAIELGDASLLNNQVANILADRMLSRSSRSVAAPVTSEVAVAAEAETQM